MKSTTKNTNFNKKQLHIMGVALEIFAQKGYNGASVRDIAQLSNVNLAMINYYFGSKLQLLEAIFEHMTEVSKSYFDSFIVDDKLTPIEKLHHLIDAYIKFAMNNKHFIVLLMRHQFAAHTDVINELIHSLKMRYWRIFQSAFSGAQKTFAFRKDVKITALTSIVMGTLNYLISDKNFVVKIENIAEDNPEQYHDQVIIPTMNVVKEMLGNYISSNISTHP